MLMNSLTATKLPSSSRPSTASYFLKIGYLLISGSQV